MSLNIRHIGAAPAGAGQGGVAIRCAVINYVAAAALGHEDICADVVRNIGAALLVALHSIGKSYPWQGRDIQNLLATCSCRGVLARQSTHMFTEAQQSVLAAYGGRKVPR